MQRTLISAIIEMFGLDSSHFGGSHLHRARPAQLEDSPTEQNLRNMVAGVQVAFYLVLLNTAGASYAAGDLSWQRTSDYPIAGYQYDPVTYRDRVYVFGGYSGSRLTNGYAASINSDGTLAPWAAVRALPEADQGPGAAVYSGWVYVALESGHFYRAEIFNDGSIGTWLAGQSVPTSRSYRLVLKPYKGFMYLVGGEVANSTVRYARIDPDGSLAPWSTTTAMPQGRQHQSVHFFNDRLYIAGGISGSSILNTVFSAPVNGDGTIGTWRQETSLPVTLWYHHSVLAGNQIYLFGGSTGYSSGDSSAIYRAVVDQTNGTLTQWANVGTMPDTCVNGPGSVYHDTTGTAFLIGGFTPGSHSAKAWRTSIGALGIARVSNVRALQRAGTRLVDITYTLALSNAASASVGVTISTNGGTTYSVVPASGTLSNAVGSGILPGTRTVTWDAGQTLPSTTFGGNFRARITATTAGGYGTGDSGPFTLDLAGISGGLTVRGRVLSAQTRAPVASAVVTLAGRTTTTSSSGEFSFSNTALSSGNTLTVSKSGFATHTQTVAPQPGTSVTTLDDILLQPSAPSGKPIVTGVSAKYDGIFLAGVSIENEYTADVGWNGTTPGTVEFYVNDQLVQQLAGPGPLYTCSFDLVRYMTPSFRSGANTLRVLARSASGAVSAPCVKPVVVVPLPEALVKIGGPISVYAEDQELHLAADFSYPDPPLGSPITLPVLGRFGAEFAVNASFDYTLTDGDWEATLGYETDLKRGKRGRRPLIPGLTRYPKLKLYIGNKEVTGKLDAFLRGTATEATGIRFTEVGARASLTAKLELGRYGIPDLVIPASSTVLNRIPGLHEVVSATSVIIWVMPGIEGEVVSELTPVFQFRNGEITGSLGLEASYEPKLLGFVDARFAVGGLASATIAIPSAAFIQCHGEFYGEAEFDTWLFTLGPYHKVFAEVTIPSSTPASPAALKAALSQGGLGQGLKTIPSAGSELRVMDRSYLKRGPEGFVAGRTGGTVLLRDGRQVTLLEAFRALARTPVRGSFATDEEVQDQAGVEESLPAQLDFQVSTNVFPNGRPALSAGGTELMLLYVTDAGLAGDLQRTDIKWTRWDGTNWSEPQAIATNTQAEFAPQVALDGAGDAIAVWERVADPNLTNVDLAEMAAQMEIVSSRWTRTNGAWSEPQAHTANSVLDHAPLLCGPMSNGDVLMVWTRNQQNLLMGTNDIGADEVRRRRWNGATRTWMTSGTLLSNVSYRLSQSLAGAGDHAVYAFTRDVDGVPTNDTDQEVFYCEWTNGAWGAVKQFTTNSVADKNVRAAVSTNGDVYLVWQSGTNLVMNRNFSTNISLVRADAQTAGFADFAMTFGPGGNLVLVWQEMSEDGSDAYHSVYDPLSDTWSQDARLFRDSSLERSFALAWDSQTNLTVAYNKVEILRTNKTVELEGGGTVTITNVPQPGRVDLCVTKRQLIKDLALPAGDFTVQGGNFLPGDTLTLSARVRNAGDLALTNVVVRFYDGNPTNGGTVITNLVISGWLEGASTNAVASALWVVPEPATNHVLFAVVDPTNAIPEFNETNNLQAVSIGGRDLAVSLVSYSVETNGALRVIAQVHNQGAPSATNSVLAIRREGATSAPLATTDVPLLEPGRLAQVALDLPSGTQPEGEAVYRLFADETRVVNDVQTNNNTSAFAVNLWLDADGDGMPDGWESANGFSATNAADAFLDFDGDGASNLAEYRAGTSPTNALSYLRLDSISVGGTNGVQVAWGSASNRLYAIQRASALVAGGNAFTNLAEHILSTPPQNVFFDGTATNASQLYYRIKVE